MKKQNKVFVILIVLLPVLFSVYGGYLVYDKVLNKDNVLDGNNNNNEKESNKIVKAFANNSDSNAQFLTTNGMVYYTSGINYDSNNGYSYDLMLNKLENLNGIHDMYFGRVITTNGELYYINEFERMANDVKKCLDYECKFIQKKDGKIYYELYTDELKIEYQNISNIINDVSDTKYFDSNYFISSNGIVYENNYKYNDNDYKYNVYEYKDCQEIQGITNVKQIVYSSLNSVYLLTENGSLYFYKDNKLTELKEIDNIKEISATGTFLYMITNDKKLYSYEYKENTGKHELYDYKVTNANFFGVGNGLAHTYFVNTVGKVYMTNYNNHIDDKYTLYEIPTLSDISYIVFATTKGSYFDQLYAVDERGVIYFWTNDSNFGNVVKQIGSIN